MIVRLSETVSWLVQRPILAILMLAFGVRLLVALCFANVIADDEIYQYLEQAHRLVFGQGLVPWEYQVGMRNWLIPFLLAVPMEVAHWFFVDPLVGLILIRVCLCFASLGIVWAAAKLGERFFGHSGVWIAGLMAALAPDLWLMAPHSLEEVFAADCLVPALYLVEVRGAVNDTKRVAIAGLLLGFACVFRLQLAPAIAVAGIFLCRRNINYWCFAQIAAAVPVVGAGIIDWVTWGQPFRSFWLDVDLNLFHGLAARAFGQDPFYYYLHIITLDWLWSMPVIAVLCWRGSQILPATGWSALLIIITHTALAHKEIRFIFPAVALFVVLAGIGLAGTLYRNEAKKFSASQKWLAVALLAGPFFSPLLVFSLQNDNETFVIFESIKSETSGIVAVNDYSRAYLPLDLLFIHQTFISPMADAAIHHLRPGLILSADPAFSPAGYHRTRCFYAKTIRYFLQWQNNTCVWMNDTPHTGFPPQAMVNFSVPPDARNFEVVDRLFPDELPADFALPPE